MSATQILTGVRHQRFAPGSAVGRFLTGQGIALGSLSLDMQALDSQANALGDGRAVLMRQGSKTVVGLFDLVEGRVEDLFSAAEKQAWVRWRGRFAFVLHESESNEWLAVVDHFGTLPLFHSASGDALVVSTRLAPLLNVPWCSRTVDLAAVYHYLNFACVPAPLSIVAEVKRLPPASVLRWKGGKGEVQRWWRASYPENLEGDAPSLAAGLREQIVSAVERYRPEKSGAGWGSFLSGGTDSSSITTILARQEPNERVHSFSIGFAEAGYDELDFARIAASACGAQGHFGSIDEAETLDVLPHLPGLFDQPFGNASAVPTLACAAMAAGDGRNILLAGDGGDEIFGGNERYSKDQIMQRWFELPSGIKALGRALGRGLGGGSNRFLNRVDNFARRASLPNPDRFYTDDAFASEHFSELLGADFQKAVTPNLSLEFLRQMYAGADAHSEVNRVMALDLELAIAQNDLVKVDGAARHVGVSVRFPFLDPDLVTYTGRLKAHWKVSGTKKRVLFRQAVADILPPEILKKPKQGFGLPISVWMRERPVFREWLRDLLLSERSRQRGWFEPAFVSHLFDRHQAGAWDYSAHLWSLAVLELWVRNNLEGGRE